MFSINQQAINGQSLLLSALMGRAQKKHKTVRKGTSLSRFSRHTNITLFTLLFWSITYRTLELPNIPDSPSLTTGFASRHGHRQNPQVLLHKISTTATTKQSLGFPQLQPLLTDFLHCSPFTGIFTFYLQASTNSAAAFEKEWAALTEHLREQKIPGMWQRAAHREVLWEDALIWSHRQD